MRHATWVGLNGAEPDDPLERSQQNQGRSIRIEPPSGDGDLGGRSAQRAKENWCEGSNILQ
jgi:hypothetical protein